MSSCWPDGKRGKSSIHLHHQVRGALPARLLPLGWPLGKSSSEGPSSQPLGPTSVTAPHFSLEVVLLRGWAPHRPGPESSHRVLNTLASSKRLHLSETKAALRGRAVELLHCVSAREHGGPTCRTAAKPSPLPDHGVMLSCPPRYPRGQTLTSVWQLSHQYTVVNQ